MQDTPLGIIALLVDADTVFTVSVLELIPFLEGARAEDAVLWGVVEFERARDAYLYLRGREWTGFFSPLTQEASQRCYRYVFGERWEVLLSSPQPNNGVLLFQNCRALADAWRAYYRLGLELHEINPADDQVPLAAAITATGTRFVRLSEKFNSKGAVNGTFGVYHPFAGLWRSEFRAALAPLETLSNCASVARQFLREVPAHLLDSCRIGAGEPFEYLTFPGVFTFEGVYRDVIQMVTRGVVVEIGTHRRKSTCFMAELIRLSKKDIRFYSADIYKRPGGFEELNATFKGKGLSDYVTLLNLSSREAASLFADRSIDFLFIDRRLDDLRISDDLIAWLPKVRPGGIIAGDDYTSTGLGACIKQAVDEFADANALRLSVRAPCYMLSL